jgi:hypothetical protein
LWNLNDVLNMRRFHKGPDLGGEWILFMWSRPAAKLLKNLALIICPFFSSGANFEGAEVVAANREDSSRSIRELWPDIDKLDDLSREDISVVRARDASIRGKGSAASIGNTRR